MLHIAEGHHVARGHVAEHADLLLLVVRQVVHLRAADDDVRLNADLAQLGDALLGGLGLGLAGGLDIGQQGHVDEAAVVPPHFKGKLAQGLQEEETLDVAHRAADFGDDDVAFLVLLGDVVEALLDLVRYMGDVLDGLAQVIAAAFLFQHMLEDLAARQVVQAGELAVDEALVVAQV